MKALLMGFAGLAMATALAAQESLTAAKDLYASAAYEDALSTLTRLHDSTATGAPVAEQIDQYRAFCLFALGRTAEAGAVAESLIARDPLLQLDDRDASPRIMAMFGEVRKRLLPGLARDQYRAARASIDRKDFTDAELQLTRTRQMLEEAQKIGVSDETLGDLRVLVDGFLELTRAGAQAPAPALRSQPRAANPSPVALTNEGEAPKAPNPRQPPRVYDSTAFDVVPPVALLQQMPRFPPAMLLMMRNSGVLDLIIDQEGNVERADMREHVNEMFDRFVLDAARTWKYHPAMKDGLAVRYLKTITLVKQ
jgi:hypothetical protein